MQSFFISQKQLRPTIPQWIRYFLEEHLQPWFVYIKCIWQIFLFKAYFYFKWTLAVIHLSGTTNILGGHWQWSCIFKGTVFLLNKHLQSSLLSKVLSQFASPVAAIHSMNYPFSITKEQLQSLILSNLLCFCRTGIVARRYHKY